MSTALTRILLSLLLLLPLAAHAGDAQDFVAANPAKQASLLERWSAAPEAARLPLIEALQQGRVAADSAKNPFIEIDGAYQPAEGDAIYIHEFLLEDPRGSYLKFADVKDPFEDAFTAVWDVDGESIVYVRNGTQLVRQKAIPGAEAEILFESGKGHVPEGVGFETPNIGGVDSAMAAMVGVPFSAQQVTRGAVIAALAQRAKPGVGPAAMRAAPRDLLRRDQMAALGQRFTMRGAVGLQARFAAVMTVAQWIAVLESGDVPERSNILSSFRQAIDH